MAFDFDAVVAPFRMQPGLRRLDAERGEAHHLTPVEGADRWLREKLAVLAAWPLEAAVSMPGFDPEPALQALAQRAAHEHPTAFALEGRDNWQARRLGWSVHGDEVRGMGAPDIGAVLRALPSAWRRPALLALAFREDLAIIEAAQGRIPWILACLPSGWAPAEKVGRPFTEVHAPVADNARLLAAADGLARLVTSGDRWERFVWTLVDDPRLHRHPHHVAPSRWEPALQGEALIDAAWLRSERQTFLPVPDRAQAVFTIEVEVRPLREALAVPDRAQRLGDALASMSDAVIAYRGLALVRERLVAAIAAHAGGTTA